MRFEILDFIALLFAILIGGLIGAEREFRDKAAGFRTLIFISLGAALFTIFSRKLGAPDDITRIAANIVSGVGFLGAGVIMRDAGRVTGLTTAAMIWLTAALGMGVGAGLFGLSLLATAVALLVLLVFPRFERWIENAREQHVYEVVIPVDPAKVEKIQALITSCRLKARDHHQSKVDNWLRCSWEVSGHPRNHRLLVQQLLADADIREYCF